MPANEAALPAPMVPVATTSMVSTGGVFKRRACVSCTTAKIRCVRRAGDDLCERCTRLGKRCTYLDLPQRKRKQGSTRRLDGLQARFDDLEARLSDNSSGLIDGTTSSTSLDQCHSSSSISTPPSPSFAGVFQSSQSRPTRPPEYQQTPPSTSGLSIGYVDVVARGIITEERAETLLADFRLHHVRLFPFVALSSEDTASKLRQESPLLFLVALSIALCSEPSLQKLLGEEFLGIVGSQLFKQEGRSLDTLRALLAYTAWSHYFAASQGHSQLFLQAQLCVSLVYHLNLDMARVSTSTEIRALLGTYWLSTCASIALRRPPVMRYSKLMEEHCERLAAASEYETDRLIRPLVLSQSLCCRVYDAFYSDNSAAKTPIRGDAIIHSVVDVFVHELELIKMSSITETWPLTDSSRIMLEFSYVESYIREGSFYHELWDVGPQGNTLESTQSMPMDYSGGSLFIHSPVRIAMLWRMLDTDKACIRHFIAFDKSNFHGIPVTVTIRICYSLANLIRLIFTLMNNVLAPGRPATAFDLLQPNTRGSADAADPTARLASESTNVMRLIDEMVTNFETYAHLHHAAAGGNNPTLTGFVSKLKRLSRAYRRKLRDIGAGLGSSQGGAELMAECGGLGPAQPGQTDPLHIGDHLNEELLEPARERATSGQPDSWPLAEEAVEFDFNEQEWESILNTFTLP